MSDKQYHEQYINAVEYSQHLEQLLSVELKNTSALLSELAAAERERDELRAEVERVKEQSTKRLISICNAGERADKAEAELARRDAAASEPVAWQYRYNDGKVGDWHTVDSESECNHHPFYERRPIYTAAAPAVLPPDITFESKGFVSLTSEDFAYNRALEDSRKLGAQQQKVVELPTQSEYEDPLSAYEALEHVKAALDAANVKWEVKK